MMEDILPASDQHRKSIKEIFLEAFKKMWIGVMEFGFRFLDSVEYGWNSGSVNVEAQVNDTM